MTLQDVKCFLLDMDGTFYLGNNLIEGSLDFIEKVRTTGRDFLFLTNNSSHNANFYVKRLHGMGLDVPREKILTSGEATADKLNQLYPGKRAFVLGNEYLIEEFTQMGTVLLIVFIVMLNACLLLYDRLMFPMVYLYVNKIKPRLKFIH